MAFLSSPKAHLLPPLKLAAVRVAPCPCNPQYVFDSASRPREAAGSARSTLRWACGLITIKGTPRYCSREDREGIVETSTKGADPVVDESVSTDKPTSIPTMYLPRHRHIKQYTHFSTTCHGPEAPLGPTRLQRTSNDAIDTGTCSQRSSVDPLSLLLASNLDGQACCTEIAQVQLAPLCSPGNVLFGRVHGPRSTLSRGAGESRVCRLMSEAAE